MSFWDRLAREMQWQGQIPPVSTVAPGRWRERDDNPQPEPEPEPEPEPKAEEMFLDRNDPMQAYRPQVGGEVCTVSVSPRSWETNSRRIKQDNQFGQNIRERAQLQRDLAAGRYNTDGVDVIAARQNAAAVRELNQQHLFDSSENQRMPQRF